jgi:AcrR family transcriptional regulator
VTGVEEATASLRERKKEATRLALHRAVTELAAAKGLDAVTVEAIADHANVSRRTFSNYFASKEDAFLYGERRRYERLLTEVRGRPASETPWQALRRSVHVLVRTLGEMDPVWIAQLRIVWRHPSLAAHQMGLQSTVERDLVAELTDRIARQRAADRTAADRSAADADLTDALRARVLAGTFFAATRAAIAVWIDQQEKVELAEVVDSALVIAAERLR